ncbi:MAG: WD40 repeat domain-containing protein [Anaerolineales bacterium]|nr:WD40 repeat domain-containing protein [Anaerolineales bacterium]
MKSKNNPLLLILLFSAILLTAFTPASAQTGNLVRVLELSPSGYERAHTLAFSSDGKHLAVGGTSGIYLFDTAQFSQPEFIQTGVWARSLLFLPQTNLLAAGLFDNTIKFWDISTLRNSDSFTEPTGWVRSLSLSRDGSLLSAASDDDTIRIWNVNTGELTLAINEATGIRITALSPDGSLVAGGLSDNSIRVWKVSNGELLYTLTGHTDWPRCLAFSPDGGILASCGFDRTIHLWKVSNGSLSRVLEGHKSSILGIAFSPDGETIATGSVDQTVRLWNLREGSELKVLQGHKDFVYAVAFSPDGKTLASGGGDNTVRLWDLNDLTVFPDSPVPDVQSDCRQCHHRRGQNEPARVIDLSCEACHAGGIGLSWCTAFPRSSLVKSTPITYNAVYDVSGVPINNDDIAIVLASPGNGETFYVIGYSLAPEIISGRVYSKDPAGITNVKVRLDIISNGEVTQSLETSPTANGDFTFNVAINIDAPPAYSSKPATRQCTQCHDDSLAQAGIPIGTVNFVVTATSPGGQTATDSRWARVDASQHVEIPVQVLDDTTNEPLAGLTVEASTILYEWRDRFSSGVSSTDGIAILELEQLSQAPTVYDLTLPPQILNGVLYVGSEPTRVTLDPYTGQAPAVTLTAHAVKGRIEGGIESTDVMKLWALQLPAGPLYQVSSTQGKFTFGDVPVGQYLLTADVFALADHNLSSPSEYVDLFENPKANVEFSPTESKPLSGTITTEQNDFLPFAWVDVGEAEFIQAADPSSGEFLISNLPSGAGYVTAFAPGYYAIPKSISDDPSLLDFQLKPRPETQFIDWNDGWIILPPETNATFAELKIDMDNGWLWGKSKTSIDMLNIHLPNVDIEITGGSFALEVPVAGRGWLYISEGEAKVTGFADQAQVQVRAGEMIALTGDANPISVEASVIHALHPALANPPVAEIIEPTLTAKVRAWITKAGIGALQVITFITYVLSLATLFIIVIRSLFLNRRRSPVKEKPHAGNRDE